MTFYLKPPRGDIALEKLEELALKRWTFLNLLPEKQTSQDEISKFHSVLCSHPNLSDSVMENSSKDRVSHFFLRLAVSKINDFGAKETFLKNETSLFLYRLNEVPKQELRKSLCDVMRHIDEKEVENEELNVLSDSIATILREDMLKEDSTFQFQVPFQIVPTLVSKRLVPLKNGFCTIDCKSVKVFLSCLFMKLLKSSLNEFNENSSNYGCQEDDQRISNLIQRIKLQIQKDKVRFRANDFKARDVESISSYFPPCFSRVHEKLRTNHRLGHHSRIAYTLFLKEVGLDLNEAMIFWSHHYSRSCKNGVKCSHSWQEHGKKFEYSINHLYGNAGGRKNYSAHSCTAIAQRCHNLNDELTCPFVLPDIEEDPRKKCCDRLREKLDGDKRIDLVKPSQYFNVLFHAGKLQ